MALGREDRQVRFDDVLLLVDDQLPQDSVYRLLAEHGAVLFGDEYFADLFTRSRLRRPTVPARVVATVMLLQAFEGLSDREACDRLAFDLRWKAAAGLTVGAPAFHATVLVGMRNRLRASDLPRRLFDDVNATARAAGLLRGRRRVLDSTPLFDAVATQIRPHSAPVAIAGLGGSTPIPARGLAAVGDPAPPHAADDCRRDR
ncbi:transposase [Mycobacterium sp. CVI_P3]|uniref:Transposase n=1 Tax=Mycobacterium pinniadriaticum TaxID=2994102 RepID=A0ABT3SKP3_9MYCO|nr:transposase [Mycobacterium pinniadriaticum]MCX2933677.1 transposase [Mycobacterium pinniadriaticum]MCX2940099.1 transposase [Mycobacterium pinniadriaticum]